MNNESYSASNDHVSRETRPSSYVTRLQGNQFTDCPNPSPRLPIIAQVRNRLQRDAGTLPNALARAAPSRRSAGVSGPTTVRQALPGSALPARCYGPSWPLRHFPMPFRAVHGAAPGRLRCPICERWWRSTRRRTGLECTLLWSFRTPQVNQQVNRGGRRAHTCSLAMMCCSSSVSGPCVRFTGNCTVGIATLGRFMREHWLMTNSRQ